MIMFQELIHLENIYIYIWSGIFDIDRDSLESRKEILCFEKFLHENQPLTSKSSKEIRLGISEICT
jgi:hypothetical protein